ncbi:coiled-coil domain-containing protein 137 [Megalopta genalis]|uniref:coiled-coil domain-containing protein 137 n=1 Tax=Megalopta genalis TaxID=115081 RepID=UPI003FD67086
MGRKIPGKKHRGVKDPLKQQAKRHAELETKINAPPKDVDEQSVPKSLERVVKLKEAVKSGKIKKIIVRKRKKKNALITVGDKVPKSHPKSKPEKVVPVFKQRPNENEYQFLHRVNTVTHNFINETAFEKKFGVQVNRNPETGNVEGISKCEMTELDKIDMLRAKHKNIKKKKKKGVTEVKMTKSQKRREKLKSKKERKEQENAKDFGDMKDQVKFGEVVHEPPQIKIRPKAADSTISSKPGKKNLLLHSLLKNSEKKISGSKKALNRTGKLRNLPIGERRQLEKDQNDIIEAYRRLKAHRSFEDN